MTQQNLSMFMLGGKKGHSFLPVCFILFVYPTESQAPKQSGHMSKVCFRDT